MLCKFLKYLQPTNYFSLLKNNGDSIFPEFEDLPESVKNKLTVDHSFQSELAQQYDLSWQAIQKGYIGTSKTYSSIKSLSIEDNYYFSRKYFHPIWVFYVLMARLLGFNNPVKEISVWYHTRGVKRSDYLKRPLEYKDWQLFDSQLVKRKPKVSVIIPTLNRYVYLKDVLYDLEKQDYTNFEVIIVDQSEPFKSEFFQQFNLDIQLIRQEEKALWKARNHAIKIAQGDYLLFFDDDSRVDSDWVSNHLKCLDFFNADVSSGVSISKVGANIPEHYSFFRVSDQLDTGNALIKKDVFKVIGLYDRQFEKQRMGDGEFGLRSYLNNFLNVSNPYAKRLHLKVESGGLRDMGSWDAFRTKKWFAPKPIPSVLYFFRRYFGNSAAKKALFKNLPSSIIPYRFKKNKALLLIGVFVSVLILPVIVYQVSKSWYLSGKK